MIKMYIGLHVKYPLFLSDFNDTCISRHIFENDKISNFMKIRPVGVKLFHAKRWTDGQRDRHDESNSRFS